MAFLKPPFRGQFDGKPFDPALPVELLAIRRLNSSAGVGWQVTGALTRIPGGPAEWVEGFADDRRYGSHAHSAEQVWEYFTDKRGGNGYTIEVDFLWIGSQEEALWVLFHVSQRWQQLAIDGLVSDLSAATETAATLSSAQVQPVPDVADGAGFAAGQALTALPFHVADVLSWRLVVELVRRHPDLWLLRDYPMSVYDCLTVVDPTDSGWPPLVSINRNGMHASLWPLASSSGVEPGTVVLWTDYLYADDPRAWLLDLEQQLGLPAPSGGVPASTPGTLALRWIAQFLSAQIGSRAKWTAWMSDGPVGHPDADSFADFPAAAAWARTRDTPIGHLEVWFVGPSGGKPHFALSRAGDLWTNTGTHHYLRHTRRGNETITSLVARTAGTTLT